MTLLEEDFLRKLERLTLALAKASGGGIEGLRLGDERGGRVEFRDHRDYVPGDELRYVDWNAEARLEKLYVKEFEKEKEAHLYLLLDASASMGPKFDYARRLAAALSFVALHAGETLEVCTWGNSHARMGPVSGAGAVREAFSFLASAEPGGAGPPSGGIRGFLSREREKGAAVVISDFWEVPSRGFEGLVRAGHESAAVRVLTAEECDPRSTGKLELRDLESGKAIEFESARSVLDAYAREFKAWSSNLRASCLKAGVRFVSVRSDQDLGEVVFDYFRAERLLA